MSYTYDLTGVDSSFKRTDARFVVFKEDQVINFEEPVFASSIKVTHLLESGNVVLVADIGWRTSEALIDYTAMSKGKAINSSFDSYLVTGIVLKVFNIGDADSQVSIDYQSFRRSYAEGYEPDGDGPPYSPGLMKGVLSDIEYLKTAKKPTSSSVTTGAADAKFLEEDLSGEAVNNYIEDEVQTINVPSGDVFLKPAHGSFYSHDLIVKRIVTASTPLTQVENGYFDIYRAGTVGNGIPLLTRAQQMTEDGVVFVSTGLRVTNSNLITSPVTDPNSGTVLITSSDISGGLVAAYQTTSLLASGTDYKPTFANLPKTRRSTNVSGVYDLIQFIAPIVGSVTLSYHAFGGEVSVADANKLQNSLVDLITNIQGNSFVTEDNLANTELMQDVLGRLDGMEEFYKHYLQIERSVAINDSDRHWYSIAFMWDNRWSGADVGTSEIGHFRIESLYREWLYDFTVEVNLTAFGHRKMMLHTIGASDPNYVFSQGSYQGAINADIIQARLIWIDDGTTSGVALQLGIRYDKLLGVQDYDTLIVTNKSGKASRWKLWESSLDLVQPEDTNVTLPTNSNIWISGTSGHNSIAKTLEPANGLLLHAGCTKLTNFSSSIELSLFYADLTALRSWHISGLTFAFFDRKNGEWIRATKKVTLDGFNELGNIGSELTGDELVFYLPDMCAVKYRLLNYNDVFQMRLESILGSSSYFNDRFDLRHIVAHLN